MTDFEDHADYKNHSDPRPARTNHTVVSTPGDHIQILTKDRDEWKKRALAAEAELKRYSGTFATGALVPKESVQMSDQEYHNRCDNTPWCRCGNGKCK